MRALVTGAAGFLGAAVVDHLLARGDEVTAVDDLTTGSLSRLAAARAGNAERPGSFSFHHLAVGHDAFGPLVARLRPDAVHHLVRDETPLGFLAGAVAVLDAAVRADVRAVVIASAPDVYGDQPGPLTERAGADPRSAAAAGRVAVEAYARAARHAGVTASVLVVGEAYGPGAGHGAVHEITAALRVGAPVRLAPTYDLVHAADVARAFALAADLARVPVRRLHVAGPAVTGDDLHAVVAAALGVPTGPTTPVPAAPRLDVRAARQVGWTAALDWREGVADAVRGHPGLSGEATLS